jgi:hypothetical protein
MLLKRGATPVNNSQYPQNEFFDASSGHKSSSVGNFGTTAM